MTVRRLTPEDAPQFVALRHLGLERHPEAFATGAEAWRDPSPEAVAATLGSADAPWDRFVLGAFEEDRLVGLLGFKREPRASVRHKGSLWGFVVHPDHRRRGHGGALVRAAVEELRRAPGLEYVRLVVTLVDEDALRIFLAHGFVQYATERGGIRAGGRTFDQAFLRHDRLRQSSRS